MLGPDNVVLSSDGESHSSDSWRIKWTLLTQRVHALDRSQYSALYPVDGRRVQIVHQKLFSGNQTKSKAHQVADDQFSHVGDCPEPLYRL